MANNPPFVVEFSFDPANTIDTLENIQGIAGNFNSLVKFYSGMNAFRYYNAFAAKPMLNTAGNLRGMVVSKNWRTVFRYSSDIGDALENVGYVISIAGGILESKDKIQAICDSDQSLAVKSAQIATIAGTIAERALADGIIGGVNLIYLSLDGYCQLAGLPGGSTARLSAQCSNTIQNAKVLVNSTVQTVTDAEWQGRQIWNILDVSAQSWPTRNTDWTGLPKTPRNPFGRPFF